MPRNNTNSRPNLQAVRSPKQQESLDRQIEAAVGELLRHEDGEHVQSLVWLIRLIANDNERSSLADKALDACFHYTEEYNDALVEFVLGRTEERKRKTG